MEPIINFTTDNNIITMLQGTHYGEIKHNYKYYFKLDR